MVNVDRLKKYAEEYKIPIIQDDGLSFLIELINKNKITSILEIGSAIGYSSIQIALNTNCFIDTIEINKKLFEIASCNIKTFLLEERIKIINEDAVEISLSKLKKYDLIFIDGPKAQYRNFFKKFKPLLNNNGLIVTDNLSFHGLVSKYINNEEIEGSRNLRALLRKINDFIEMIKKDSEFETEFYEIGDGMSVSRKLC